MKILWIITKNIKSDVHYLRCIEADKILILFHASLGGIALLTGLVSLLSKKGHRPHIISGKIFYWTMLLSAITAIISTFIPGHKSPFLFAIGIFSTYLILTGKRAVKYKTANLNLTIDKTISSVMILTGIIMIAYPIIFTQKLNILLTVFGSIGLFLGIQDLRSFKNTQRLKANWLQAHIGKMIGGYIAAVTAFLAVGQYFHPLINWLGPTMVGVPLIIIWNYKVKKK